MGARPAPQEAISIGAELRRLRLQGGLTRELLAERAGLGVSTLKALETGQRRPHANTVVALAAALDLPLADRTHLLEMAGDSTLFSAARPAERALQSTPASPLSRPPVQLPNPPTALIGREAELEAAAALLDPARSAVRLLTLIGPGGMGKTRLAVAVATRLVDAYPDGVVFVDLAPVRDARLVLATVARALGLRERRGHSAYELLLEHLGSRRVLLVLDNFEHLLDGAPQLANLLEGCPRLGLLVTSRAGLRLRAEQRLPVPPLPSPGDAPPPGDATLASWPGVRLFAERAQVVAPDFVLDAATGATVAAICRWLDGMPLAIELAAARAGLLRPEAMLQRLQHRLPLLTTGAVDAPQRQRTLRQTLAWSHDLLGTGEQVLFRRLAVFAGGWTLEAAETVCTGADNSLAADEVLDRLQVLVDSNLIQVRRLGKLADEPRFGMLETLREYATEQLVHSGEYERMRAAHAIFYSRMAEPMAAARTLAPWVQDDSRTLTEEAVERLEAEFDNLQEALNWWESSGRPAEGLRLAVSFYALSSRRTQLSLARRWLERMLELADRLAPADAYLLERALALGAAGTLASLQGDNNEARAFHRRSVAAWRQADHAPGLAIALGNLGLAEWVAGEADRGVVLIEEALVRARGGRAHTVAVSLRNLGLIARSRGQYARAEALFRQAADYPLPPGWFRGYSVARSVSCLGRVAYLQEDYPRARALLRQAFETIRQAQVTGQALADCLDWQAALEAQHGDVARAVRLFGAAETQWRTSGTHRFLPEEDAYARDHASVRAAVDEQTFATEWSEGAAMQAEEAIAYALQELDSASVD